MTSGMPISAPTWVSVMCRSSWISGITGGTTSSGIRIAAPASQSSASTPKMRGWAGRTPGAAEDVIEQDALRPGTGPDTGPDLTRNPHAVAAEKLHGGPALCQHPALEKRDRQGESP